MGFGEMDIIEGKMDALRYRDILSRNLLRSAITLKCCSKFTFLQDNDPKHTAKSTQTWFQDNSIDGLDWPSQLPDLNTIICVKNLRYEWMQDILKILIKQLKDFGAEVWAEIKASLCKVLIVNYERRLEAVKQNKLYPTKY